MEQLSLDKSRCSFHELRGIQKLENPGRGGCFKVLNQAWEVEGVQLPFKKQDVRLQALLRLLLGLRGGLLAETAVPVCPTPYSPRFRMIG